MRRNRNRRTVQSRLRPGPGARYTPPMCPRHALFLLVLLGASDAVSQDGLLFRASLDRSSTAELAGGDREPLTGTGVQVSSGASITPNACLTYDARANLYAEQGTVSFRWRPDAPPGRLGFPLFLASFEQHSSWDYTFARIEWTGSGISARIRDRNMEYHGVQAAAGPIPGTWMHVALSWGEPGGLALGTAIAALFNATILLSLLRGRLDGLDGRRVGIAFGKIAVAAIVMAFAAWGSQRLLGSVFPAGTGVVARLAGVGTAIAAGVAVLAAVARVLRIHEFNEAVRAVAARVFSRLARR